LGELIPSMKVGVKELGPQVESIPNTTNNLGVDTLTSNLTFPSECKEILAGSPSLFELSHSREVHNFEDLPESVYNYKFRKFRRIHEKLTDIERYNNSFLPQLPCGTIIDFNLFIEILHFLLELFSSPGNFFVNSLDYVRPYVTNHFNSFLRIYSFWKRSVYLPSPGESVGEESRFAHSNRTSSVTNRRFENSAVIVTSPSTPLMTLEQQIQIANLHLRILLSFAVSKDCDVVRDVFQESEVVHMLSQEIDLEHTRMLYETDLV
jgi:hypothetical protein